MSEEEGHFYKYADNLDKQLRERYGKEGEEDAEGVDAEGNPYDFDYEPSIAGISLKETRGPFFTLYALGIIALFIGAIYIGN